MCDWVWVNKRKKRNSNPRPGTVFEMSLKVAQTTLKVKKSLSKVHFMGTVNLYLVRPDAMQKTKTWSEHPGLRKQPKTAEK